VEYVAWRAKLATSAYDAVFDYRRNFVSKDAHADARNIHAFFTQTAMVARCFIPARAATRQARARAEELQQYIALDADALESCLQARHDLDHFDERIDGAMQVHRDATVTSFTIHVTNMARLEEIAQRKPLLAMLIYLIEDHAIVTFSRDGIQTVTKLDPIRYQLSLINAWHIRWVDTNRLTPTGKPWR
jgi:hypothetical protein